MNNLLKNIEESFVLKLNEEAKKKQREGELVYNLTIGQLNFEPPEIVVKNLENSLKNKEVYGYSSSQGLPELRKSILLFMEQQRNISFQDKEVLVSNGVKQSLYIALKACINPKDRVGVITPYWLSYPALIEMNYGKVIKIKHKNFLPDLADLENKIQSLKVLIINNPNNPSGMTYPLEFLKSFSLILKKNPQLILFSDEIYSDLCTHSFVNYYHVEPSLLHNSIIFHGPSKSMAISGLRLGFAVASKEIIQAMTLVQSHVSSNVCHLLQDALKNYTVDEVFLKKVKIFLEHQRNIIKNILTKYKLKKLYYETDGAFYFLLSLKKIGIRESSIDIAKNLAKKNIYVTPSSLFGIEGYLRLSLSVSSDTLEMGLTRILEELK